MKKIVSIMISLILVLSFTACGSKSKEDASANLLDKDWNYILEKSKGTTVNFYGFGGNEATNRWLDGTFTNKPIFLILNTLYIFFYNYYIFLLIMFLL